MCGRYVSPEHAAIERAFHVGRRSGNPFKRKFNVFPSDTVPFLQLLVNNARADGPDLIEPLDAGVLDRMRPAKA